MANYLIINGTLIHATHSQKADIAVSDGKIEAIGKLNPENFAAYDLLDASDKYIFSGGIDPHVHLALPTPAGNSSDDFSSGSRAAIAGGTTSFIDFVTPRRGQSLTEAVRLRKAEAAASKVDYSLHAGISEWNINAPAEIVHCIQKEGITSFKTYLAYRESIGISYAELKTVMEIVGPAGGMVLVHCEDGDIVSGLQRSFLREGSKHASCHAHSHPPVAEIRAVEKVIELSAITGCPVYIVHTSTAGAVNAIHKAKQSGLKVSGETCIQYLMLDDAVYDDSLDNIKVLPYVISPPLRSKKDQEALWKGLSNGTFDTLATDHCPFNLFGQKDLGINDFTKIPNGAGGIEHRLSLLYTYGVLTKKITIHQFVNLTSTRPAEIFGFGNRKGKLQPGFDADIVIWNLDAKGIISAKHHFQNCDSEIYEGIPVQGKAEIVLVNGKIAFRDGMLITEELKGKFISR